MTRVVACADYLLDLAVPGRPGSEDAAALFEAAAAGRARVVVPTTAIEDFWRVTARHMPEGLRLRWVGVFTEAFEVAPVDSATWAHALALAEGGGELACCVAVAVAVLEGADAVVTSSRRAELPEPLEWVTAAQALR